MSDVSKLSLPLGKPLLGDDIPGSIGEFARDEYRRDLTAEVLTLHRLTGILLGLCMSNSWGQVSRGIDDVRRGLGSTRWVFHQLERRGHR